MADTRPEPLSPGGVNKMHQDFQTMHDQIRATRAGTHLDANKRELFLLLEAHLRCCENLSFAIGNDMERWG